MFLEKLEIFGFKAIPYKLRVQFGTGVTGIIGPNGCGKSNFSDAIRWVLGEQSVRQLRGHSMEDVIFNGTANRKPLGVAEVSLTFSNARNTVPIDYDTVAIGRRLYRSGQSEYLINKTSCRLRDVKDLLLDTGIGSSGYSLIAREMVESVLADDSGQRRQMLEEAAGISKYKARKREALNKLKATEADLVRVADIVAEVEREVRSLGRQVGKARRYRRFLERIRQLDLALSRLRVHHLAARRDELAGSLAGQQAELGTRRARVQELDLELEQRRLTDVEIERALSAAQAELDALDRRLAQWDSEAKVMRERRLASERRITEAQDEVQRLAARQGINAGQLEQAAANLALLVEAEEQDVQALREREERLRQAEREWRQRRAELGERKQLRLDLVEHHVERRAAYAQACVRREEIDRRIERLHGERQAAETELAARATQLEGARRELAALRASCVSTQEQLAVAEQRVADLELRERDLAERAAAFGERAAAHASRLEVLFDLKRRYEGYARGVQALLAEGRPDGLHGTVSELLRVPGDLIEAMEAALGGAIGYIVADGRRISGTHIDHLRSTQGGRATFLPIENLNGAAAGALPDHGGAGGGNGRLPEVPGTLGLASRLVEPTEERFRPVVDYLLADVLVVDGRAQALDVVGRPQAAGYRVVTRDGELWSRGGIIAGGATGGTAVASPLGREQEIAAVEEALAGVRRRLQEITSTRETLSGELAGAQADRQRLGEQGEQEREMLFELDKAVQAAELAWHAQTDSIAELERALTEQAGERAALESSALDLGQALHSARCESDDFEAGYAELETEVVRLEEQREQRQQQEQACRLRWTENVGRLSETRSEIERLEAERRQIEAEQVRRRQEIADSHAEIDTLAQAIAGLEEQARRGLLEREGKEARVRSEETRFADTRSATAAIEEQVRAVRRGLDALVDDVHQRELELERARNEIETTSARIREEYELELLETQERLAADESPDAAAEELSGLRERMRTLGPVNLLAIEQHDEVKERFRFLTQQRDDLVKAREELLEAIERINRAASDLFKQTFAQVRENFIYVFTTLFAGGDAELRLVGDELEGSIEIMARPRGKKLRSISLMSGGERALIAISLLFAIYLAKPSPFCIMDEVDAPLDDANVERFVDLLRRFSNDTQFIVITHNKKTMEAAERLYGVTMEEPGVTKLVSVRLEHGEIRALDEQPARAAAAGESSAEPAAPLVPAAVPAEPAPATPAEPLDVGLDAGTLEAELDAEALEIAPRGRGAERQAGPVPGLESALLEAPAAPREDPSQAEVS